MTDEKKPKIPPPPLRPPQMKPPQQGAGPAKAGFPPPAPRPQGAPARPPAPAARPTQDQPPATRYAPGNLPSASSEVDEIRKHMESQIMGLQNQLQEEKEKLLMQTVRAKEEEAMAAKVEESLKDIQDRLRREKREQELQEALSKSELLVKDLEQRMGAERQTWVETLKSQVNQRESQDKDLEHDFELKLKELERRWHEEKLSWSQALRSKEEEVSRLKRETETAIASDKNSYEKRISQIESERDSFRRELKDLSEVRDQERAMANSKLESRDKEFLSLKAQQAMVVTQMRQGKEKEDQLRALLEKMRADKNALLNQVEAKDKEYFLLKTQFALYQTRAKTEQEKILSEMLIYKGQMQKDREQWEINFRSKENELRIVTDNAKDREAALKQALEKKETEYASMLREAENKLAAGVKEAEARLAAHEASSKQMLEKKEQEAISAVREAEERLRARETETRYALERKDAEIKAAIKDNQDKIAAIEQAYAQQSAQKDKDSRTQQLQLIERIQVKEKEINTLNEKERDLRIQAAQYEQNINRLEEKLKSQADASIKDIERYAQKEKEQAAVIAQKENDIKSAMKDLAEALSHAQGLNLELAKKEQQVMQLKAEVERKIQSASELAKINEIKTNEVAGLVQKEKEYQLAQARAEQQLRELNDQLRLKSEEHSRLNEKAARAENEIKQAEEKSTRELAEKTREISALIAKDSDSRVQAVLLEQKVRELGEKIAGAENHAKENAEIARNKETELLILQERLEQFKMESTDKLVQQSDKFNAMFGQLKEESVRILNLKELELRDLRNEKENLKAEAAKASTGLISKINEAEALKNILTIKEKEAETEIQRMQGIFKSEKHALTEKIKALEELLKEAQKKPDIDFKRVEIEWNKKEDALNAMLKEKDAAVIALRAEVESWKKEKEKLIELKSQTDDMNQAELMSVQRKLWENKEKFSEQLKEKEKEIESYKEGQKGIEEKVRKELFEKYKAKIEELEKENEALSRDVTAEVGTIRTSLQADLKKKEEQYAAERAGWESKLKEKEAVISDFVEKLDNLNVKLKEKDSTAITQALKEMVKAQAPGAKNTVADGDKTIVFEKTIDNFDKTAIIELPKTPEAAGPSESKKDSFISAIWKNINEPVIEIGTGKKETEKKDK